MVFKDEVLALRATNAATSRTPDAAPSTPPSRDRALDCVRGWAILWMASTHVAPESKLTALLHLPLYISAFEWFSLLSGYILGMRAWRASRSAEVPRLLGAVRQQTFLLFRVHVLMVLTVLVVHDVLGVLNSPSIEELGGLLRALFLVVTLGFQPVDFMNILPLYITMFLSAPLLVRMLNRGATGVLLALSSAAWLVGLVAPDLLPFPVFSTEPRSFSLLSWQFIFVLGLVAGYHREGALGTFWAAHRHGILCAALVIAGVVFIYAQLQRQMAIGLGLQLPESMLWLLDKKTFGPVRAIYTIASLLIAVSGVNLALAWSDQAGTKIATWVSRLLSEFELMGRRCLTCFVLHLVFALTAVALELDERTQVVSEIALIVSVVLLYCCVRYTGQARHMAQRVASRVRRGFVT